MLLSGQLGMLIMLLLMVIFNEVNVSVGIVVAIVLFVVVFQLSIGCIFYVHTAETTADSMAGVALNSLFMWLLIQSILAPILIRETGSRGVFVFFACCVFLGFIYEVIFFKDSTFKYLDNGQCVHQTEKDKKQLYCPPELRDDANEQLKEAAASEEIELN